MKNLLTLIFALYSFLANATDYYVSSSTGNDSYSGLSRETPFKTIAKVKSLSLVAGDKVLLKRGDVWYEDLTLSGRHGTSTNFIRFTAYGYGESPTLNGSTPVIGWTDDNGDKIWEAPTPTKYPVGTKLKALVRNGDFLERGRWPNEGDSATTGWLFNDVNHAITDVQYITDYQLPSYWADNYWQGARVVAKSRAWILDYKLVESHVGSVITIGYSPHGEKNYLWYGMMAGYGYYFTDSYKTLDKDGEWFHDTAEGKIYLYSDTDPNDQDIRTPYHDKLLDVTNSSYLHFQYINFKYSNLRTANFSGVTYSFLKDCRIQYGAQDNFRISGGKGLEIAGNHISYSQNNNFEASASNSWLHDNVFSHAAIWYGMGISGSGQYMNVKISGTNNTIEHNEVSYSGYNAIHFSGKNNLVSENLVNWFNMVSADGGGVYIFDDIQGFNRVEGNIVMNGLGDPKNGTPQGKGSMVSAYYSDGGTSDTEWEDNYAYRVGRGLFNHLGVREKMRRNTMVAIETFPILISWDDGGDKIPSTGNEIADNTVISIDDDFPAVMARSYTSSLSPVANFGTINYNKHVVPLSAWTGGLTTLILNTMEDNVTAKTFYYTDRDLPTSPLFSQNDILYTQTQSRYDTIIEAGANLVVNSDMSAAFTGNWTKTSTSAAEFSITQATELDGTAMKASFTTATASLLGTVNQRNIALDSGAYYRIKFSIKGTVPTTMLLRLRADGLAKEMVGQSVNIETTRRDYEFTFKCFYNDPAGRIYLHFTGDDSTVYIDNFQIHKVNVTLKPVEEYVRFEYNFSRADKSVTIPNSTYVYPDGTAAVSPVIIKPYKAVVLLKL